MEHFIKIVKNARTTVSTSISPFPLGETKVFPSIQGRLLGALKNAKTNYP